MTPAGVKPGDIADHHNGAGSASDRMIVEDRATGDGPAVVVHVEETISPALAGVTKASSTRARRCRA